MKNQLTAIVVLVASLSLAPNAYAKRVRSHVTGVKDRYVVALAGTARGTVSELSSELEKQYNVRILTEWDKLRGFLMEAKEPNAEELAGDPRVAGVEQDQIMIGPSLTSGQQWTSYNGAYLWYLDRLDEEFWGQRDGSYWMCPSGGNTTAYVIDKAVWRSHAAFNGRVTTVMDCTTTAGCLPDTSDSCRQISGFFNEWHGTAVASLLTGEITGAARPEVISMMIYPCTGGVSNTRVSWALNAVEWIWNHAPGRGRPAIVNHSGFFLPWDPQNDWYEAFVRSFVSSTGIPYFAAANNWTSDACLFSPAGIDNTYTEARRGGTVFVVGATADSGVGSNDDFRLQVYNQGSWVYGPDGGSNSGECVSAYAPGGNIYAARHARYVGGSPIPDATAFDYGNGSSFSTPLVAGLALRWMEERHQTGPIPPYGEVYAWLLNRRSSAVVQNAATYQYSMCYNPTDINHFHLQNAAGTCENHNGDLVQVMPGAANTSNARVLWWYNGTCP